MGCACGKRRGTLERPFNVGPVSPGDEPVQIKLLMNIGGSNYGDEIWAIGRGVQTWIDRGLAQPV